jgi:hypothetical protein
MEGSGYFMLVDGNRQDGGKEPSVMQAMKQKLEKMLRKVRVWSVDVRIY